MKADLSTDVAKGYANQNDFVTKTKPASKTRTHTYSQIHLHELKYDMRKPLYVEKEEEVA